MRVGEKSDFFLSRRGSVAAVAQEVADVLVEKGYKVVVQDYDFAFSSDFVEAMHEAIKNSRDLVVLFTRDYENSPYTRKEFTSFEANRLQSAEERRLIILRCEDVTPLGLFAGNVYQDLVGIDDPAERKRRIIAAAEGHSLAPRPPPRPFDGVPPRNASFTGCAVELDRLDAILIGGDEPAVITQTQVGRVTVQGLGGVGKTALAIEYAYRYRDLYAGVCWCPCESRIGLTTGLASLAHRLGVAAADEPDFETAAKTALRRLSERRATWLLVYDNVTDPEEIADLLPSTGARVLITSRFPDWSGWAAEVTLDVLPPEEAVAFLETRAGRRDEAGARTLADTLGCLPLALDHAAAYCRRTQANFKDYAAKAAGLITVAPRGAHYPRSVAATFELAIASAVATSPAAETLMGYLAHCAPERIPMSLINDVACDEVERAVALLTLAEVSLIKHDPFEDGLPAITVHRLVQAVARKVIPLSLRRELAHKFYDYFIDYQSEVDEAEYQRLDVRQEIHIIHMISHYLRDCVEMRMQLVAGKRRKFISVKDSAYLMLLDINFFLNWMTAGPTAKDAIPAYATLLQVAMQIWGKKSPRVGYFMYQLSGCYVPFRGTCLEGYLLSYRAAEIMEKHLDIGHDDIQRNRVVLHMACMNAAEEYGFDRHVYDPSPLGPQWKYNGIPPDQRPLSFYSLPSNIAFELEKKKRLIPIPRALWD